MILQGKRGLIVGLANADSIAWGITQVAHQQGAQLGFTYLNAAIEKRMRPLAEGIGAAFIEPCDVNDEASLDALFQKIAQEWGGLDFLVHSVAFAQREDLMGRFCDTSRQGFLTALETSAYSLVALSRRAQPLMKEGGSIVTLSYYGAEKAVQNYNVMGVAKAALEASVRYLALDLGPQNIRVNAISAGAIKTLSARGIHGFSEMLHLTQERAPLKRCLSALEVGRSAAFLLSDQASAITGETLHVDCGYNIVGM